MFSGRKAHILNIIVDEYVTTAQPVGSKQVAMRLLKEVSPATIRNDMADLEEQGYILRPHTSAGGVPSSLGYRRYVTFLEQGQQELPSGDRAAISTRLRGISGNPEGLMRAVAASLASIAHNAAVVTYPRSPQPRLRHLDMVKVQQKAALLVVLTQEQQLRRHLVRFADSVSQDQLLFISNRLNSLFNGLNPTQIQSQRSALSPLESVVLDAALAAMEGEQAYVEAQVAGIKYLLDQPEFAQGGQMREVVEVLEDVGTLSAIMPSSMEGSYQVLIGEENPRESMRQCSIIMARYGSPDEARGVVSIIGPTRMQYQRSIAAARSLASLMDELLAELYEDGGR